MNDFIKNLVNYVIEAKITNYRGDQSAETYRLSRINREISPSDAPADKGSKFAKINADYKEEKRLERAPRGPQTRKKPMEEGTKYAIRVPAQVKEPVRDTSSGQVKYGIKVPAKPQEEPKKPEPRRGYLVRKPVEEGAQVPKGAVTGPVRQPTIIQKQQTANPSSSGSTLPLGKKKVGDPASRADWAARKAAMDKAIDG